MQYAQLFELFITSCWMNLSVNNHLWYRSILYRIPIMYSGTVHDLQTIWLLCGHKQYLKLMLHIFCAHVQYTSRKLLYHLLAIRLHQSQMLCNKPCLCQIYCSLTKDLLKNIHKKTNLLDDQHTGWHRYDIPQKLNNLYLHFRTHLTCYILNLYKEATPVNNFYK